MDRCDAIALAPRLRSSIAEDRRVRVDSFEGGLDWPRKDSAIRIMNASSFEGPVDPAILHPQSMNVTESWGDVKDGGEGAQAFNYQVQLVVTAKGTWIACWTQGGHESTPDQRMVVSRSTDGGRTWSEEIVVEPSGTDYHVPAWIMLYHVPATGRVYAFFWWNTNGCPLRDAGDLYFRYSDDDGLTWSKRFAMGVPGTSLDDGTDIHGWNFGQPRLLAATGAVMLTYAKIRQTTMFHPGYRLTADRQWEKVDPEADDAPWDRLIQSYNPDKWYTEVFMCELTNILTETDPEKL
ncbi:MAG TPA: exo-alpha-sialidase [Candidatus Hydrogenedentes bacterium]|nr:exo-alpha-sialidase [Candidatus Hydrogenedentota bacterium]